MLYAAYELERDWGWYITNDQILGMSRELIDRFTKYLANKRAQAMGLELLFPEIGLKNPISWFDSFSSFNDQKTNFFEGNVVNYSKGSLNLDDF
jgi:ribonucleoside-diphosphate reductase beta chain